MRLFNTFPYPRRLLRPLVGITSLADSDESFFRSEKGVSTAGYIYVPNDGKHPESSGCHFGLDAIEADDVRRVLMEA